VPALCAAAMQAKLRQTPTGDRCKSQPPGTYCVESFSEPHTALNRWRCAASRGDQMRTVCFFLMSATLLLAQRPEVEAWSRLYKANCANCHGLEGANVAGVDLGHNKFNRASTDDDLVRIITTGIPNTGMPPAPLPRDQAQSIVTYLRSLGAPSASANG